MKMIKMMLTTNGAETVLVQEMIRMMVGAGEHDRVHVIHHRVNQDQTTQIVRIGEGERDLVPVTVADVTDLVLEMILRIREAVRVTTLLRLLLTQGAVQEAAHLADRLYDCLHQVKLSKTTGCLLSTVALIVLSLGLQDLLVLLPESVHVLGMILSCRSPRDYLKHKAHRLRLVVALCNQRQSKP